MVIFLRHFEKSLFSGFHGYKPQARKLRIAEHSRQRFFRVPSRTGANHSLFNILSGFCLCHFRSAGFQSSFSGLIVAASGDWKSLVAFR